MGKLTIFDYAKVAAQAEQRILEMMDAAPLKNAEVDRKDSSLQNYALSHQGQESSG